MGKNMLHRLSEQILTTKTAEGPDVPQEGHPTDKFNDRAELPTGPEIAASGEEQRKQLGTFSATSTGQALPKELNPANTAGEISPGGDNQHLETPEDGSPDPGPDSSHPASPDNTAHKYASINDPRELAKAIQSDLASMIAKVASLSDGELQVATSSKSTESPSASSPKSPAKVATAPAAAADDTLVGRMKAILGTPSLATAATTKIASLLTPIVEAGVRDATLLAHYLYSLDDPKLAEAMLGDDPAAAEAMAGAAAGGDPAAAMGGDPAAMGGGAGGGEVEAAIDQLGEMAQAIASHLNVPAEQLLMSLAQVMGGGGEAGAGEVGGGEMAAADPAAAASDPAASADAGVAAMPADETTAAPEETAEPKTAASPQQVQRRQELAAQALRELMIAK